MLLLLSLIDADFCHAAMPFAMLLCRAILPLLCTLSADISCLIAAATLPPCCYAADEADAAMLPAA